MHLIFERSNGRFKSNCNILALAWMPHYNEAIFRRAHLEYHQRLLTHLTGPTSGVNRPPSNGAVSSLDASVNDQGIQELIRQHGTSQRNEAFRAQGRLESATSSPAHQPIDVDRPSGNDPELLLKRRAMTNSRLYEQYHRFVYMKSGSKQSTQHRAGKSSRSKLVGDMSNVAINDQIDEIYGRTPNFGWLAIGNIGKIIGVTLTSTVQAPKEIDGRKTTSQQNQCNRERSNIDDLIVLDDDLRETFMESGQRHTDANQRDEVTADTQTLSPLLTATSSNVEQHCNARPDRKSARTNHNLRGHFDEIILVKWNELYQKLASVDSKGNVLIWSRANNKFTIQTPFYNKSKSVADFKWSNDGKTALICYTDSFILVSGSSGQRHWHSMLNLDDYHITCATWAPNDEQLLLGVSNGNIVIIDLPNSELTELVVGQANIRTMCWSSCEINLRHLDTANVVSPPSESEHQEQKKRRDIETHNLVAPSTRISPSADQQNPSSLPFSLSKFSSGDDNQQASATRQLSSIVVNRRRLSRNCALFCRYRPQNVHNQDCSRRSASSGRHRAQPIDNHNSKQGYKDILAIDFADNTIKLFDGGLEDQHPREIQVNLESYLMAWSSDGKILAVAGFNIYTSAPSAGYLRCKYLNSIKFYNQVGDLIYERKINFTRYPITALTWAHDNKRLFVATGPRLHCAKVFMGIPKLSLLSLSCLHRNTKLMDKSDVLKNLIKKQLVTSVLNWQSFNCPLDISTSPTNLTPSSSENLKQSLAECHRKSDSLEGSYSGNSLLIPAIGSTGDESSSCNDSDNGRIKLVNNINIINYQLPAKLKFKIDQLFSPTIRQPYDEQLTLNDIAWLVPKNQQRHYCTLICYTHELPDVGCIGHQYKVQESLTDQRTNGSTSAGRDSDQFKIFILYAEFQGSLVPILKARRIGFLKPEFVVFDPEDTTNSYFQRNHKVSDVSNQCGRIVSNRSRHNAQRSHTDHGFSGANCAELHETTSSFGHFATGRHSSTAANCRPAFNIKHSLVAEQIRCRMNGPLASSSSSDSGARGSHRNGSQLLHDRHLSYLLYLGKQKATKEKLSLESSALYKQELLRVMERHVSGVPRANISLTSNNQSSNHSQRNMKCLPENSELIRIRSNIWGTKFKMINMGNRKIGPKAILGSVKYKASLLHLQPRQIYLNLKDMSNYCILCSMHHHTRVPPKRNKAHTFVEPETKSSSFVNADSLLDLPLVSPGRLSSGRPSRSKQRLQNRDRSYIKKPDDKVVLAVGDNIRVAPKLELNQKYKFAGQFNSTSSTSSGNSKAKRHRSLLSQSSTHSRNTRIKFNQRYHQDEPAVMDDSDNSSASQSMISSSAIQHTTVPSSSQSSDNTIACYDDNDILTLSLDQGDQVQVEMSSTLDTNRCQRSSSLNSRPCRSDYRELADPKIDEFLQANKTLKSIQTITKMIVDLSSRAQDDNESKIDEDAIETENQPSPMKLLKTESGTPQMSPLRQYIPPETPVHRPRRLASANDRSNHLQKTQSATSSPLAGSIGFSRHYRGTRGEESLGSHPNSNPLPPPPPSVPFRRKLSSSAKRFFDGSLRSLASLSGGNTAGYLTCDELDSEDCETLVNRHAHHSSNRTRSKTKPNYQSQPCTPLKDPERSGSMFTRRDLGLGKQSGIDLASFRSQVVQKLRSSTSWMSSSSKDLNNCGRSTVDHTRSNSKQHNRSLSYTKRSSWVHRSGNKSNLKPPQSTSEVSHNSSSSSSSSSDLISLISSSDFSSSSSSNSDEDMTANKDFGFLDQALRSKLFKRTSSKLSSSAREFGELSNKKSSSPSERNTRLVGSEAFRRKLGGSSEQKGQPGRRRRRAKRSICRNSNCCCAREFKMSNRPPVWNEYSQVYQLDFGGRVTQESAKNLQIDFNGTLALQFGRIDKCTYTLDYQYPFNAVQAMSIALASLTQRLK